MFNLFAKKNVVVIVAHPDDETLWAGGTMLLHPLWNWFIVCLSRKFDTDRSLRFHNALKVMHVNGVMGDLDDGPDQVPLDENVVKQAIRALIPAKHFDLIITHNPSGEYTKHLRHEEISKAVIALWYSGKITTDELHVFAYEDENKKHYPFAIKKATLFKKLSKRIWQKKYAIITNVYGFEKESWEANTTPKEEAFWKFTNSADAKRWLEMNFN